MKKLVLAGGGHGHIMIIKELAKNPIKDLDVTLVSDFRYQYYSGMLPGYMEGIYCEEEICFDVQELCGAANIHFVLDRILEIDANTKQVKTENSVYPYDLLSMNLGSSPIRSLGELPPNAIYAKPIFELVRAFPELSQPENSNIVIVGAGAAGAELILSLSTAHPEKSFTLVGSGSLLAHFNDKSRQKFLELLKERDIPYLKKKVLAIEEGMLQLEDRKLPFDFAIIATGVTGPEIKWTGFKVNAQNQVLIDSKLRADSNSVAMGDMVQLIDYPKLPKAGVFAIRQAPILKENLSILIKGLLQNEKESCSQSCSLKCYCPQKKYLAILNTGHKMAILNRGNWSWHGRIPWYIKDWIDRRYMNL